MPSGGFEWCYGVHLTCAAQYHAWLGQPCKAWGCSPQMRKEKDGKGAAGKGRRKGGPGLKPRPAANGSSKGSRKRARPAEDSEEPEDSEDEEDSEDSDDDDDQEPADDAMQDAVSGSERFTDADEVGHLFQIQWNDSQLRHVSGSRAAARCMPGGSLLASSRHCRVGSAVANPNARYSNQLPPVHCQPSAASHSHEPLDCTGCIGWCGG
jgi:hypothetical protein